MNKNLMTPQQLANEIGVHEKTLRKWFNRKQIPGIRMPSIKKGKGHIRFNLKDVQKALKITMTCWLALITSCLVAEAAIKTDHYPFHSLRQWRRAGKPVIIQPISHRRDGTLRTGKASAYGTE